MLAGICNVGISLGGRDSAGLSTGHCATGGARRYGRAGGPRRARVAWGTGWSGWARLSLQTGRACCAGLAGSARVPWRAGRIATGTEPGGGGEYKGKNMVLQRELLKPSTLPD